MDHCGSAAGPAYGKARAYGGAQVYRPDRADSEALRERGTQAMAAFSVPPLSLAA